MRLTSLVLAAALSASSISAMAQERSALGRAVPPEIMDPPWLEGRMKDQLATAGDIDADVDFKFTNRASDSWIAFRNRITDDAAVTYKAVHYSNGNTVAVADVDGDGRLDVLFTNQVGANELWRNIGGGRFEDITDNAGIAGSDRISVAASFADIDNDGDPDVYITAIRQGNMMFENLGDGKFKDITASSGLGYEGHSSGAVFFDFDHDGLLDVYLTNVGQYTNDALRVGNHEGTAYTFYDGMIDAFSGHRIPEREEYNRLYRNIGNNRFIDVSDIIEDALPTWTGDASIIDVNGDGWMDIYALNMQGNDEYYENQAGKSFVRKSRAHFPKTSWGAMGIKVFDWNNDGDMDIYITDMHSDMSQQVGPTFAEESAKSDMQWEEDYLMTEGASIFGNSFFDSDGNGGYKEISDDIGVENFWPWGVSVGDLNADGFQDMFVTAGRNYPFRYQTNFVLLNEQGKNFSQAEFIVGVEPRLGGRTSRPWFGLDCATNLGRIHGLCKDADGMLMEVWGALGSRSAAIFDLDNDGDLDIVTNEFNSAPMVLINDIAQRKVPPNFLKIELSGTQSNAQGIGATVIVSAGGNRYTQFMDGKSGYLSQSAMPLYFGLGEQSRVDGVEVRWPSGEQQRVGSFDANVQIRITEPAADAD